MRSIVSSSGIFGEHRRCAGFDGNAVSGYNFIRRETYCHGVVVKNISNRKSSRSLRFAAVALSVAVAAGLAVGARIAGAANVSGLMSYRDGKAADRRQLHYENRVTNDIFVAPTKPDGSFTADLPPGVYDLRAERGVVLASKIRVDNDDINSAMSSSRRRSMCAARSSMKVWRRRSSKVRACDRERRFGTSARGDEIRARGAGSIRRAGRTPAPETRSAKHASCGRVAGRRG